MPLAMILVLSYLVLMVSIHAYASQDWKIFSQIGLSFAVIAALILLVDYFVQFSVVPISLMSGETEGIALLTQYNPHGIFIALEELGYILMSLSFLFVAPVFADKTRLGSSVRGCFSSPSCWQWLPWWSPPSNMDWTGRTASRLR
jgi:hypothetical protein